MVLVFTKSSGWNMSREKVAGTTEPGRRHCDDLGNKPGFTVGVTKDGRIRLRRVHCLCGVVFFPRRSDDAGARTAKYDVAGRQTVLLDSVRKGMGFVQAVPHHARPLRDKFNTPPDPKTLHRYIGMELRKTLTADAGRTNSVCTDGSRLQDADLVVNDPNSRVSKVSRRGKSKRRWYSLKDFLPDCTGSYAGQSWQEGGRVLPRRAPYRSRGRGSIGKPRFDTALGDRARKKLEEWSFSYICSPWNRWSIGEASAQLMGN